MAMARLGSSLASLTSLPAASAGEVLVHLPVTPWAAQLARLGITPSLLSLPSSPHSLSQLLPGQHTGLSLQLHRQSWGLSLPHSLPPGAVEGRAQYGRRYTAAGTRTQQPL